MNQAQRFICAAAIVALLAPVFVLRHALAEDWLPIPPGDFAMKDNPASPGADAMVLYRESAVSAKDVDAGGDSDEEYMRLKIFTQSGVKKGDVEIAFYKAENDVKDIRGRTIHPDGTIVNFTGKPLEKEIVRNSGIRILAKTFSLPDVQPGSIIEYKYRIQGNPHFLHDEQWIVSTDLFTREAHFSYVPYEGYSGFIPMMRRAGLPAEATPKCDVNGKCTMETHNIPAVVDEALMPPQKFVEARVEFYYISANEAHGESPEAYWSRIIKKLNGDLEHFIEKKSAFNIDLAQTVTATDTPEAKLRKIYARVLKIRNLSVEDLRTKQEENEEAIKRITNAEDVLRNGYGTGRHINYLFVGLARAAGFDATEVYVATRNDHAFSFEAEDARDLNADLVWVSAGGKEYYVDPGAKYFPFGLLPWYETNDHGLRAGKKGAEQITTPLPVSGDATIVRNVDLSMDESGELGGTLRIDFAGQEGASRREKNRREDEIGRKKAIEDEIKSWLPVNASLDNTTISNWDNTEEPLRVETTLKMTGVASSAGKRVLVPAEIFRDPQVGAFGPEKRVNIIYVHYPYEESDDLKVRVPKGYKIASVPAPAKVNPGPVNYELSGAQQGDTAEIKRHLLVNSMVFPKDTYPALRSFFNSVRTNDDSQMVLQYSENAQN